jgi:O-antigen ligase
MRFEYDAADRLLVASFSIFVVAMVATALLGADVEDAPDKLAAFTLFATAWLILPRMRMTENTDYLTPFITGAGFGAVAGLFVALSQTGVGVRPSGGAGNAAVFGYMSLCLGMVGGLGISSATAWRRWLAAAAAAAAVLAVTISLTRWLMLVSFITSAILFVYAPREWLRLLLGGTGRALAILAAVLAVVVASDGANLIERFWHTVDEVNRVAAGGWSSSIGERLRLWEASWAAIQQSPWIGYGIQNRMDAIQPFTDVSEKPFLPYTHVHNGFLSFALDGGIIVVIALIAMLLTPAFCAWRAPRDENHRKRLFMALLILTVYAVGSQTQILFKHDIMDAFFVCSSIIIVASIRAAKPGLTA